MPSAITFDRVTKQYRGSHRYVALRDDLMRAAGRLVGIRSAPRHIVRALDEVSFEIPEGQSFALIGLNGAGKTTALKIATRIAYPTSGSVGVRGRVGALIEVGTGMHPELTGRENIHLYGRILGLSRRDVQRRFDDIVEFAGLGVAIDQPVKQFSSGMQLRLGFSLAAHLEPDILLVDEAIAVGDAGFQYRCTQRMSDLVREGRTLVFVSHDMSAIETLCQRAVLLRQGKIAHDGPAREVVREYLLSVQADQLAADESGGAAHGEQLELRRVTLHDAAGNEVTELEPGEALTARLHSRAHEPIPGPIFSIGLSDGRLGCFTLASMLIDGKAPALISGDGHVDCTFEELPLRPRTYEVWGSVRGQQGFGDLVDWQRLRLFRVKEDGSLGSGRSAVAHSMADAPVTIPYHWDVEDGGG
ncbi:MAG: ABC transporter ATP-binding protein [Actinobacteria bacterium]|nr:ABC transporter ATP-binding protein [Actinomycetota bacterium]